jgi:hypothetical protein
LYPGFDETFSLVEDLVGVKASWHDSGYQESLETGGRQLGISVWGPLEVREGVSVGIVRVYPRVDVLLEDWPFGKGRGIDRFCLFDLGLP